MIAQSTQLDAKMTVPKKFSVNQKVTSDTEALISDVPEEPEIKLLPEI